MHVDYLTWNINYDIFTLYNSSVTIIGGDFVKKSKISFYKAMTLRFLLVIFIFSLGYFIFSGYKPQINSITNVNSVKSLEAINIISRYDNRNQTLQVRSVKTMKEVAMYGPSMPVSFVGQMTAYNPICKGCTGIVYCPPRQNVTNGNIYFNDSTYGNIRIMAADPAIPCGTIVKINNLTFSKEPIIGIVLDRGGAIKGNIMDFLVTENDDMDIVGRQHNVKYEILRWGW